MYLAAAMLHGITGEPTERLLFDGLVPRERYRWVRPPEELSSGNQLPDPGSGALTIRQAPPGPTGTNLSTPGNQSGALSTPDGQATILFGQGVFPPLEGESAVRITVTPIDPATVGAPPAGYRFDGNAYRIDAAYAATGVPPAWKAPATLVLRSATAAIGIAIASPSGWDPIAARQMAGGYSVLAGVPEPGIFVPIAPEDLPYIRVAPRWLVALTLVVILVIIPVVVAVALLRS